MLQLATYPASLLRRSTWIGLGVITVISCATLAAHGVSSMLASRVVVPSSEHARTKPVAATPARLRRDGVLTARNMFCASCVPAGALGHGSFTLPPAVLIETNMGDPRSATVHVLGSDVQGSWGTGDAIPGLGRVHRIAPLWIEIATADGQLGRLRLLDLPALPGPDSAKSLGPAAALPDNPFGDRLVAVDDTTYEVDRGLIREMLAGASTTVTGRLVPSLRNGVPSGLKVYGVRPRSIPFLLKLQNGDELEAVNGISLTSADAMLGLYAGLDQLNVVELSITRHGKPINRSLRLR